MESLVIDNKPSGIIIHNGGLYEIDHYTDEGKMVLRPAKTLLD